MLSSQPYSCQSSSVMWGAKGARTTSNCRIAVCHSTVDSMVSSFRTVSDKKLKYSMNAATAVLNLNFSMSVSYTHLRAHETRHDLVCRLLLEKKKKKTDK